MRDSQARSTWGAAFAHFGLGVALLGIIGETQWGAERNAELKPGQSISVRRHDLHFDHVTTRQGPNYRETAAQFTVRRQGELIGVMKPAKRNFPSRGTGTTETALMTRGFSQLYLSLGDPAPDGTVAVRLYYKPLVTLIWLGAVVMVVGGALSLSDRRLRVGAPRPAKGRAVLATARRRRGVCMGHSVGRDGGGPGSAPILPPHRDRCQCGSRAPVLCDLGRLLPPGQLRTSKIAGMGLS